MKLIITLFTSCFLFSGLSHAQVVSDKQLDEPSKAYNERPYPAPGIQVSPEVAGFMALFEDSEAGNLQVFSHFGDALPAGHYFTGKKIDAEFKNLFTGEYRELAERGAAYATYSIRGNAGEHYLIRLATNKGPHTLMLFTIEDGLVKPLQQLAFAFCKNGACYQQDAWITDLNGDTALDILVRFRQSSRPANEVISTNEYIYLQNEAGNFQLAQRGATGVAPEKFEMKELE